MDNRQLFKAKEFVLITFPTTHAALSAEKLLDAADLPFLVVPTPREISAGCGLSVRIFPDYCFEVVNKLRPPGPGFQEVFRVDKNAEKGQTISRWSE